MGEQPGANSSRIRSGLAVLAVFLDPLVLGIVSTSECKKGQTFGREKTPKKRKKVCPFLHSLVDITVHMRGCRSQGVGAWLDIDFGVIQAKKNVLKRGYLVVKARL